MKISIITVPPLISLIFYKTSLLIVLNFVPSNIQHMKTTQLLFIQLLLGIIGLIKINGQSKPNHHIEITQTKEVMTSIPSNKLVVQKLYTEALNQRNFNLLPDLISENYIGFKGIKGAAGFQEPLQPLLKAFPDLQWQIEEMVAEGNQVMVKWKWQGTHTAPFQHFAPTGKKISNEGMGTFKVENGKITASQVLTDRVGFLQQLEALPSDLSLLGATSNHPDQVMFIDKFFVPKNALATFTERMNYNRSFIKKLPGFVKDQAFSQSDEAGNLTVMTIAVWQDQAHLDQAKSAVQAEYQRIGFNPAEFYQQWGLKIERGLYKAMGH